MKSDWKAVGSPPRQGGLQGILTQTGGGGGGFSPNTTAGAAAATDHPSMSWLHQDYAFPPISRNSAVSTATAATSAPAPWATAMTLPTPSASVSVSHQTNTFFQQQQQQQHPQTDPHPRRSSIIEYPDIASVPMLPEVSAEPLFREYRSMSYSIDASDRDDYYRSFIAPKHLGTFQEEEDDNSLNGDYMMSSAMDDELLAQAQLRSRSKSSAAAFSIWLPSQEESRSWMRFSNQRRSSVAHIPSTYPSSSSTSFGPSMYSPLPAPSASALSNGDRERLTGLRRFSLSPMPEGNTRLQSPIIPTDPRQVRGTPVRVGVVSCCLMPG
ncbi:hypothetical protein BX666DRAFT_181971 [Dichotomocladium elegans]|nr:hypothetical protein BX666DRAFT_181971 [Dichotomocladium elegans]